jgi:hypothetical protein
VKFAKVGMEEGWPLLHPDLRQLLTDFEGWSAKQGLPEPVVTDLVRQPSAQQTIYLRFFRKLQRAMEPGPEQGRIDPEGDGTFRPLTLSELKQAKELRGLPEAELVTRAMGRFSWHLVRCAADLRSRHYSPAQLAQVRRWFEERCQRPLYEFLVHDVTAPHLHVGRRDFAWRARVVLARQPAGEADPSSDKPLNGGAGHGKPD